jgi:acetylglutamate synthase
MSSDDYVIASRYENLVRIAYNCPAGMRNGAHLCFMQNAISMENGETFAKHLGSFEKQFEKVKTYVSKALLKLSKTKPYSTESVFYINLEEQLDNVSRTAHLMSIVDLALNQTIILKNNNLTNKL